MKVWLEISAKNILDNIKTLKSLLAKDVKFMAILKSNAYGHGLEEMNKICVQSGLVDWYGVDSLDEALSLRQFGNKNAILVLGYIPYERIGEAIANNISIVGYNKEILNNIKFLFKKYKKQGIFTNKKLKIHIKVETGTSRQGIANEELLDFVKEAKTNPHIYIEGIYTHYANIEDTTDPSYAMGQLLKFQENLKKIKELKIKIPIKHSACSAAVINYPKTHFDMVRSGISVYGMWSSKETQNLAKKNKLKLELKSALTWKTKIAQIKYLKSGTPVSYGLTEKVKRDSRIAVLPIGYWDGYDRGLSSIGEVLIHGKRAKILGRICMNMTIVDITNIPKADMNDEVILLGGDITAEEIAKKINTINYEIVTRINPLIKRIIK